MRDVPNIANPAPGHLEQAERALDAEDFRPLAICPVCDGAGVVDTSPPGVDRAPWLQTDTDCPRCGGSGEISDTDIEES